MVVRNTFLIVLIAAFLSHAIIAQDTSNAPTDETKPSPTTENTTITTTTAPPSAKTTICTDPNEFPLFGEKSCISRSAYTGIFLTSIILAGISFLMLIGLLILYFIRHSGRFGTSYASDDESSIGSGSSNGGSSQNESPPIKKKSGQKSEVLKNVAGTTPLEDTTERSVNNYDTILDSPSSSAPYTVAEPIAKSNRTRQTPTAPPTNVGQKPSNSHEMSPRPPTNTPHAKPSSPPQKAAGRGERGHPKPPADDDNGMSSQF